MPPLPPRNALILPSTIRPPPRTTLFPYTTLFRSMIYSLPSYLRDHVTDTLTCTRVMAGPENIKAGFLKERDVFGENRSEEQRLNSSHSQSSYADFCLKQKSSNFQPGSHFRHLSDG